MWATVLALVQPAAPDPALMTRLQAADAKAAEIHDLTADFRQEKHTALLKDPVTSAGRVRIKGSTIRWDAERPHPCVIHIDEHDIRIYYPEDASVEVYASDEQLRRLTASPIPRLKTMQEQFDIREMPATEIEGAPTTPGLFAIRLTPRQEQLRKHVKEVRVLVDSGTGLAERLEMVDPDGDRTLIVFTKPQTNTGLKESDLELHVQPSTKESHPLEGAEPAPKGPGR
jgi:outer membrane lipoprotein-sorting protein